MKEMEVDDVFGAAKAIQPQPRDYWTRNRRDIGNVKRRVRSDLAKGT
jgi:hypothetical protein